MQHKRTHIPLRCDHHRIRFHFTFLFFLILITLRRTNDGNGVANSGTWKMCKCSPKIQHPECIAPTYSELCQNEEGNKNCARMRQRKRIKAAAKCEMKQNINCKQLLTAASAAKELRRRRRRRRRGQLCASLVLLLNLKYAISAFLIRIACTFCDSLNDRVPSGERSHLHAHCSGDGGDGTITHRFTRNTIKHSLLDFFFSPFKFSVRFVLFAFAKFRRVMTFCAGDSSSTEHVTRYILSSSISV